MSNLSGFYPGTAVADFASEGSISVKTGNYTIVAGDLTGATIQLGTGAIDDSTFTILTTVGRDETSEGFYIENVSDYNLRIILANGSDRLNTVRTDMYLHKGEGRFLFRPYPADNNWRVE